MTRQPPTDIAVLAPLQHLIDQIVRSTPIGATEQLAAELTVQTAVWVGKHVLPATPGLAPFVAAVDVESGRQLAKFGDQRHPDGTGPNTEVWIPLLPASRAADAALTRCQRAAERGNLTWQHILDKEVAEVRAESNPAKLRAELVQVAAVCAAWVSDLDRRPVSETPPRRAVCQHCRTEIEWIDCPHAGGWWAHDGHPADGHDADPQPERP
ncbi:NUDIX hydrolase [Streptomyces sp. NPDC088097]|uniref:NUDIX hydrolase n=1 Tax=Streptomyces sp. NPDC088097 TaxID=3365823 RepID=UPI00380A2B6E